MLSFIAYAFHKRSENWLCWFNIHLMEFAVGRWWWWKVKDLLTDDDDDATVSSAIQQWSKVLNYFYCNELIRSNSTHDDVIYEKIRCWLGGPRDECFIEIERNVINRVGSFAGVYYKCCLWEVVLSSFMEMQNLLLRIFGINSIANHPRIGGCLEGLNHSTASDAAVAPNTRLHLSSKPRSTRVRRVEVFTFTYFYLSTYIQIITMYVRTLFMEWIEQNGYY